MSAPLFPAADYVEVTVHFKCNLRCVHCMIEGTMDWLRPETDAQFAAVLAANATRRWKGLTLTGAEVTLRNDLPDLARRARASGFEHVRIQTHGGRLADPAYCEELVAAGIDQFFISVTAADAETHDAITGVPGSFVRTLRALENLDRIPGVVTLTNTVITERSYRHLPVVVARLGHLRRLAQMDFWTYWPMRETDDKGLAVSHVEALPWLREAIRGARALGRGGGGEELPRVPARRGRGRAGQRPAAARDRPGVLVGVHPQRLPPVHLPQPMRVAALPGADDRLREQVRLACGRAGAAGSGGGVMELPPPEMGDAFRMLVDGGQVVIEFGRIDRDALSAGQTAVSVTDRMVLPMETARRMLHTLGQALRPHDAQLRTAQARTLSPSDAGLAARPGQAPTKPPPDRSGEQAARLLQLVGEWGAPRQFERSFRMSAGSLQSNRFLLTLERGGHPG